METNFRRWTENLAETLNKPEQPDIDAELLEYNEDGDGTTYYYTCCKCGEDYEVLDPEEFDPDNSYCGGSQFCIP